MLLKRNSSWLLFSAEAVFDGSATVNAQSD